MADIRFNTSNGLAWQAIRSPVIGGTVELASRPVFKLVVGEAELPSTQWKVLSVREDAEQFRAVAMFSYRAGLGRIAPHYINLHRFAMPGFKQFELTYSAPLENGNWFLLKAPFFNGTGFYLKGSCLQSDERSRAFYRSAFRVQHAHADAFLSEDVEPLVQTEARDVYANCFRTGKECVWTLYNAAYRTQRGMLLPVEHRDGTEYIDVWNERPVSADVVDGKARLQFDIGPRSVGCIVQREK